MPLTLDQKKAAKEAQRQIVGQGVEQEGALSVVNRLTPAESQYK
jgi:hypothetical protein